MHDDPFEKVTKYDPMRDDPFGDETDAPDVTPSITSDRTFGVELEIQGGDTDEVSSFANSKGHTYGHDGSIKSNNGGCIEIQTSILKGKTGEKKLIDLIKGVKKLGFQVNGTCGTHVHLGGGDFFDKAVFQLGSLVDLKEGQMNILFERKLMLLMCDTFGNFEQTVRRVIGDLSYSFGKTYTNEYQMKTGKFSRYCVVPVIYFNETRFMVIRESTLTKMGTSQKEVWSNPLYVAESGKRTVSPKDVVLVYKEETEKFKKLKKLFYFYTAFNDVLFGMLPKQRRSNNFCKKLSSTYSLKDIQKCGNQGELEKIWYQKESYNEVERDKGSSLQGHSSDSRNRDQSVRYHSINFHSLYYRHGTVEVRMHHGTLNATSLLLWIQLHQKIMDAISNNEVSDAAIAACAKGYDDIYEGGKLLIDALNLKGTDLEKFIKHRIKKYN